MTHDRAGPAVPVDPANADQLRNWDGDRGAYWADNATRYDEGVAAYRPLRGPVRRPRPRPAAVRGAGPFAFAEPDHVRAVLSGAGFADVALTGVAEPMYVGPDAADATGFVLGQFGGMLDGLDEVTRARAVDDLHATMSAHAIDGGVRFASAVWIIEARRS